MQLDNYHLEQSEKLTFDFVSYGTKNILKRVQYVQITNPQDYGLPHEVNLYNLGFGDVTFDPETNKEIINDSERSNNGDKLKVLNTVATTVLKFFESYPDAFILVEGNTPSRNREYRIGINKIYPVINQTFEIAGLVDDTEGFYWEDFMPNRNYLAFLLRRK